VNDPQTAEVNLSLARRVDRVCTDFDAAWQAGTTPRVENFLQKSFMPSNLARKVRKVLDNLEGKEKKFSAKFVD